VSLSEILCAPLWLSKFVARGEEASLAAKWRRQGGCNEVEGSRAMAPTIAARTRSTRAWNSQPQLRV